MTEQPRPPPQGDRRDTRREERWDWREFRREMYSGHGGSWVIGLILIALGLIFLVANLGYPVPTNWWALLILIPALACFGGAWSMHRRNGGQLTPPVTSAAVTGVFLVALALIFFRAGGLGGFWPVILIVLGAAAVLGGGRWRQSRRPMA
jgi:O-antigen/teichoic acid export membrane protein